MPTTIDPRRVLVIYYSRTGRTREVARAIQSELGCDGERISDRRHRAGAFGWLKSSLDAILHRRTVLRPSSALPEDYDLVVVGTPVWNASVSAPVRTYLATHRTRFRHVAFFCTCGRTGAARAFRQMEELCGQAPVALMTVREDEVRRGAFADKVRGYAAALKAPVVETPAPWVDLRPVTA